MLCDAVREDEIFEAFLLYASLHGLSTDAGEVRTRIQNYLHNQPDPTIDEALWAFAEDRIVAPPDIVLERWGKSRIYELIETPQHDWRHCVSDSWFENDCQFYTDERDARIVHFWTQLAVAPECDEAARKLCVGSRLQFRMHGQSVYVEHRQLGQVGWLAAPLAQEILARNALQVRYLALVDSIQPALPSLDCKLIVIAAASDVGGEQVVAYASQAFHALRAKC